MKNISGVLLGLFVLFGTLGCEQDGPAENLGEEIDRSVEDVSDTLNDAKDDSANAIEDACEKVTDENC